MSNDARDQIFLFIFKLFSDLRPYSLFVIFHEYSNPQKRKDSENAPLPKYNYLII